jgi:hypothetical protein
MSFSLRCSDKQPLGYIIHEASALSRVRFPVRQFGGIYIFAIGSPCQENRAWHSCFPAITIIPNYYWVTGVFAIIVSVIVFIWTIAFVQWEYGGWVLILLSIIQFLVGGGYISPFFASSLVWSRQGYRQRSPGGTHTPLFSGGPSSQRFGCGPCF